MPWFTRFTRFGDTHMVFGQEQGISCGLACVIMAAYKINKLTPSVKAMYDEDDMMKKAKKLFGADPLGPTGLTGDRMIQLLNDASLKIQTWSLISPVQDAVNDTILKQIGVDSGLGPTIDVKPIIMLVQWKGAQDRHWVVIDTVRKVFGSLYATVCDPWDGSVHVIEIKKHRRFDYSAQEVIDFDFWGKRHNYGPKGSKGSSTVVVKDEVTKAVTWTGSVMLVRTK